MVKKNLIILASLLLLILLSMTNIPVVIAEASTGDWIVTDEELVENKTITLDGNLIVKDGGSLTLRNVTLRINSKYDEQYGISVEPEGSLFIYNSNIAPTDPAHSFSFTVDRANFAMKNSELRGVRARAGERVWGDFVGLHLKDMDGAVITGNTIYHADDVVAIFLAHSQGAVIENNKIYSARKGPGKNMGIQLQGANDNTIASNYFYGHSGVVLLSTSWNNHIANNVAEVVGDSVGIFVQDRSGNNIIEGNTITALETEACTGLRAVRTPYPNLFINNTVKGTRYGALLSYTSNQMFVNNRFVEIGDYDALQVYRSYNNLILNNVVISSPKGITLLASSNNMIQGNQILDSKEGISLFYSADNNIIEDNTLNNNSINIILDDSQGNTISRNNFITPHRQGYDNAGNNNWSRNYWSDYAGKDRGDGISDAPYLISPKGIDNEPLVGSLSVSAVPVPEFKPVAVEKPAPGIDEYIRGNTIWKNQLITLKGALIIEEGASLTLDNVTLMADERAMRGRSGEILVKPGATLYIYGSKIIGLERDGSLSIRTLPGARLVIKDSELRNLGNWVGMAGLKIMGDGAIIENNTFIGNYGAIWLEGSSQHRIVNNKISRGFIGIRAFAEASVFKRVIIMNNDITQIAPRERSGDYYSFPLLSLILSKVWVFVFALAGGALVLTTLGIYLVRRRMRRRIRHG